MWFQKMFIHDYIHFKQGYWTFHGGGELQKPKFQKEIVNHNWNFQRDGVGKLEQKNQQ